MCELPPAEESPTSKKRRITFTGMKGALGDILADEVQQEETLTEANFMEIDESQVRHAAPRQRRKALTPLEAARAAAGAMCENTPPRSRPDDDNCVASQEDHSPPVEQAANITRRRRGHSGQKLSSEFNRQSPSPLRNPLNIVAAAPQLKKLSGQKRNRVERDRRSSIGATARLSAMMETAAETLAEEQRKEAADGGNSSDEEDKSFASNVKRANSFLFGVQAAEAAEVAGTPADQLLSPQGPADAARIHAAALSRSAFKSGVRACAAAAKVEALIMEERASSRPGTPCSRPGTPGSMRQSTASSVLPSPSSLRSPGTIAGTHVTNLKMKKLNQAQQLVSSMFN